MLATHVRSLLADVGRSDVCGICGDDHPADCQLCAFRPMTFRLCTYCHSLYSDTVRSRSHPAQRRSSLAMKHRRSGQTEVWPPKRTKASAEGFHGTL
jgi:hypothetical protein